MTDGDTEAFSERLNYAMALRRLSGRQMSEKLGVDESTVSLWRNGHRLPSDENLPLLCSLLEVSESWLRYGSGYAPQPGSRVPSKVREVEHGYNAQRSAVSVRIEHGQRHVAKWLAEYSAQLLEAAAADARRMAAEPFELPPNMPHDNNDAERGRLNAQFTEGKASTTPRASGAAVPPRTRRSAG